VRASSPFPARFEGELELIRSSPIFDRGDAAGPFRDATYVFVPYCTGDLHAGDAVRTYEYKVDLLGPILQTTFHFSGAANIDRVLDWIAATRPAVRRIWLTGSSGGGYGATLNFDRAQRRFPSAEVHLLADCAPLIDGVRYTAWRDAWNLQLPEGCAGCATGMSAIVAHLTATWPTRRLALLAFDHDRVLSWFFLAGNGPEALVSPPTDLFAARLDDLLAIYDGAAAARYFVLPGEDHVMIGGYATRPDLRGWVIAWATGAGGWASVR
jgi:hypothetical protein